MKKLRLTLILATAPLMLMAQPNKESILEVMKRATHYMMDSLSCRGGFVWNYLPDHSRRWGEMEAYPTMIWMQSPSTPEVGHLLLDAYHTTGDEYYYEQACKVAGALIAAQKPCGGWNYMHDFAGCQGFSVSTGDHNEFVVCTLLQLLRRVLCAVDGRDLFHPCPALSSVDGIVRSSGHTLPADGNGCFAHPFLLYLQISVSEEGQVIVILHGKDRGLCSCFGHDGPVRSGRRRSPVPARNCSGARSPRQP